MNTLTRHLSLAAAAVVVAAGAAVSSALASSAAQIPPSSFTAHRIVPMHGTLPPGTSVKPASGPRAFYGAAGIAFYDKQGVTYPAVSSDGGRAWKSGPQLHIPAANAPAVVTEVGAGPRGIVFAYGGPGGGSAVDVSSDGGRTWYQAFIGDEVPAVVEGPSGALIAFTQFPQSATAETTVAYRSTDGGRTWHRLTGIITG